jgi:hypothetical protein
MSVRSVDRCEGQTGAGVRCKRRVANTQYCYQHLDKTKGLKVKDSHIPGGGKGLYATKNFEQGDVITPYGGRLVHSRDRDYGGDYVLQLSARKFLNAERTNSGVGRFANDCRPANVRAGHCVGNNAQFENDPHNSNNGDVIATTNIRKGQEVFADYTEAYWRDYARRRKRVVH